MCLFEDLPDDGAVFKCQRKTNNSTRLYRCGEPATKVLTVQSWLSLEGHFWLRAVCDKHLEEATLMLRRI